MKAWLRDSYLRFVYSMAQIAKATGTRNKQSHMMSIEHEVPLHTIQLILKRYLFRPIYMSFPVLDRLSSIIPCRTKARSLVREFTDLLQVVILLNSDSNDEKRKSVNCLGARLESAWREGILNIKQLRDNLNVLYVAGQENPQLLMISSLYLLGKYTVSILLDHISEARPKYWIASYLLRTHIGITGDTRQAPTGDKRCQGGRIIHPGLAMSAISHGNDI